MFCFMIQFKHDEKSYKFSVHRFDDKKENVYLIRLSDTALISECHASMLTLCDSLVKKYAAEQSVLSSFMIAAWHAIQQKEKELEENWLPWYAWFRRSKRIRASHTFM